MNNYKKYVYAQLLIVVMSVSCYAQGTISGVYNRSSNDPHGASYLFVLEDHKFAITYFGGVLTGEWQLNGNKVEFIPFKSDRHFKIYGRHNKDLKDSSRVYFQHFDKQETFIGFGDQKSGKPLLKRVFNPSPNCVPYPSVYKFAGFPGHISFSDQPYHFNDENSDPRANRNIYTYHNNEKYNDFIAYYMEDDSEKGPFYAIVKTDKLVFEDDEVARRPLPTKGENLEFITKITHAPRSVGKVFYNPFYNQSGEDITDTLNFKFNKEKNAYINFLNYVEGEEYRPEEQDAYNHMYIIYQFNLLPLADKKMLPFAIDHKSLFTAVCEEQ